MISNRNHPLFSFKRPLEVLFHHFTDGFLYVGYYCFYCNNPVSFLISNNVSGSTFGIKYLE